MALAYVSIPLIQEERVMIYASPASGGGARCASTQVCEGRHGCRYGDSHAECHGDPHGDGGEDGEDGDGRGFAEPRDGETLMHFPQRSGYFLLKEAARKPHRYRIATLDSMRHTTT